MWSPLKKAHADYLIKYNKLDVESFSLPSCQQGLSILQLK